MSQPHQRGRDQSYIVKTFRNPNASQYYAYHQPEFHWRRDMPNPSQPPDHYRGHPHNPYRHDDRASRGTSYRQADFKSRGRMRRGQGRYQGNLDDDAEMGGRRPRMQQGDDRRRGMRGRGRPRPSRGRGRGLPPGGGGRNPPNASQPSWFRVIVKNGQTFGKEFVMNAINENLPEPYMPIGYTNEANRNDVHFFVENKMTADTISALDGRILAPNGSKMKIMSRRSEPPMLTVDDAIKAELAQALSNRYMPANRTLNLSQFYMDPYIRGKGLYLPLNRQNVVAAVLEIITGQIPEVVGINLSKNRITSLMPFKAIKSSLKDLKALDLSHNSLGAITHLDSVQGMALIELNLDGNHLCDSFKEKAEYISAVRKRFPKVILLDNVELPPPIEFDVEDDAAAVTKLPESKSSYFCGTQPRDIALMFLKQYFDVFDADKRDPLMDAYHDNCRFSLSVSLGHRNSNERLNLWLPDSRNLLRTARERQAALLRSGKLEVLGALARLPKTQHDSNSFTVDVPVANERLMQISVSGVLKEREERHSPIRAFSRVFVIVPQGQGFCVVNEMLSISVATPEQIKGAFKAAAPTPSPSPIPHVPVVPGVAPPPVGVVSEDVQKQMTVQLATVTGMNPHWALKCLQENSFDYDRSLLVFNQLKVEGKVPPEAFLPA
ncbi:nuclear RNA export factor 1-like isoform X1 [Amphibalanus amphitrite]|uniref:nuclear RNA export factor 1-like isoform X1 n=1 Tax=Amphibalanus amphitrite TaxID=1232801 RepID=UPI001C90AD6B|nr:nuclear RNA export factor 1-like isoform X1 [Amphibalanus amphitrite]